MSDPLRNADRSLVVFYQPYRSTTTGHTTIRKIVSDAIQLGELAPEVLLTFSSMAQLLDWAAHAPQGPDLLIVDFPDVGYRTALADFSAAHPEVPIMYLAMHAPAADADPLPPVRYDHTFWMEGAYAPLIRNSNLAAIEHFLGHHQESLATEPRLFVCATGTEAEREEIARAGRLALNSRPDLAFAHSRMFAAADMFGACLSSAFVLCAGGYSMTWELNIAGFPHRSISWYQFSRPAEDCTARIANSANRQWTLTDVYRRVAEFREVIATFCSLARARRGNRLLFEMNGLRHRLELDNAQGDHHLADAFRYYTQYI